MSYRSATWWSAGHTSWIMTTVNFAVVSTSLSRMSMPMCLMRTSVAICINVRVIIFAICYAACARGIDIVDRITRWFVDSNLLFGLSTSLFNDPIALLACCISNNVSIVGEEVMNVSARSAASASTRNSAARLHWFVLITATWKISHPDFCWHRKVFVKAGICTLQIVPESQEKKKGSTPVLNDRNIAVRVLFLRSPTSDAKCQWGDLSCLLKKQPSLNFWVRLSCTCTSK